MSTLPEHDHLGGLVEVLKRYKIEPILVSDVDSTSSFYQKWQEWRKRLRVKLKITFAETSYSNYNNKCNEIGLG